MHDRIEDKKRARMTARHMDADEAERSVERDESRRTLSQRTGPALFVAAALVAIAAGIWLLA